MKINVPEIGLPRIVIIGGGFGGLQVVKGLKAQPVQTILLDRNNYHTFQPLLYQVATAGIEADSIVFPLRKIFKDYKNFHFRMANVERVDPSQNILHTNIGEIKYNKLVIATGADTNFFGMEKIKACSMPMKNVVEALDLRSNILQNFEKAVNSSDPNEKAALMNYVIVGGGPTGVELAGALGELKKHVLPHDYPELDIKKMQIHIFDSGSRLLGGFAEESSKAAYKYLQELGVNIHLNNVVADYDCNIVKTKTDFTVPAATLIWTAGVLGASIPGLSPDAINRGSRIEVDQFNRVKGHDNIYAIGDVASMITERHPRGYPGVAQVAIQQGKLLAKNFKYQTEGKSLIPFEYNDKGSMATVGRNRAVAEIKKFKTQGIFAWFMWMFVHLVTLVGFRNQMVVFINWVWSYFNYDRGMRLIIRPFNRKNNGIYR